MLSTIYARFACPLFARVLPFSSAGEWKKKRNKSKLDKEKKRRQEETREENRTKQNRTEEEKKQKKKMRKSHPAFALKLKYIMNSLEPRAACSFFVC